MDEKKKNLSTKVEALKETYGDTVEEKKLATTGLFKESFKYIGDGVRYMAILSKKCGQIEAGADHPKGYVEPDADLSFEDKFKKYGMEMKVHTVTTEDGFLLTLN